MRHPDQRSMDQRQSTWYRSYRGVNNTMQIRIVLLLLSLNYTGVAEPTVDDLGFWLQGFVTNHDKWELKYGGNRTNVRSFPKPSGNQVNMIERMGELRQAYWDAYNKGGADLEDAKLRFASALFYRDVYRMLTDIKPNEV